MFNDMARAKTIKLLILDVDGILTDNSLFISPNGEHFKRFNSHDGLGIKLLHNAGINIALITARDSEAVTYRAKKLGIKHIYQGKENKLEAYQDLKKQLKLSNDVIAYMGDDLADIPVMRQVQLAITVPNGVDLVRNLAHWITLRAGGYGAVREVAELILKAQDKLDATIADYLRAQGDTQA